MARTYREIAMEQMLGTVEEAMSQVIDWWGDLPPSMKEAIEQFRTRLGAAEVNLSIHPARATARRLPPSIVYRAPPAAGHPTAVDPIQCR
jgi:hypothetical protein